jgi:superfamily I DNA and/or RNA helicase
VSDEKFKILLKGEDRTNSVKAYKHINDKYEITFSNDKVFTYNVNNVQIIESALNVKKHRDCFEYLKRIAEKIGLTKEIEDGKIINILLKNYEKIDFVSQDSILGAFLSRKLIESKKDEELEPVYPFGFNASQKNAVDQALNNPLSIIEGPPGTGKTQTILNIIANAVMRGESVAVVSGNNSATKNVLEKLKKEGVDFIAAYLGNAENKNDFINSQKSLPDMSNWKLESQAAASLRQTLKERYDKLHNKLMQQNELSALKQELSEIKIEQKYFLSYFEQIVISPNILIAEAIDSSQSALEMWLLCETYENPEATKGLIAPIKRMLERLGLIGKQTRKVRQLLEHYPREHLIAVFQQRFYELKISKLTEQIHALCFELESFDFNAKMKEYSNISAQLFKDKLAQKYQERKHVLYKLNDLRKNSQNFVKDYPVILSTTYSLQSSLSNQTTYDYVIVDESSQVDLCTGALALSRARKAVIVGDLKQLPNVVDYKTSIETDAIFEEFDLPETYRYKNHSLLSAITELFPNAPSALLREHYRCHPKIIEFCNKKFYNNQLIILTEPKSDREPLVVYKTIEGNHERNHTNQRQIDVILKEVIPKQKINKQDGSLGIVTPYRNQTNALQQAFAGTSVKADTVDKFQGQENNIIILSTVDNEITEFADNANRLNVAVSRAIEQLIVVINNGDTKTDTNIGDLVRYIQYNNFSTIDSKVYSIFDYLYSHYNKQRQKFLKKQKRVSKYESENLMYALIKKLLNDKQFSCFNVAVHVPLKMIICDTSNLSAAEKQYAENSLTHVDFLIFDIFGKMPCLAIEVDGAGFHAVGSRQAERDAMKNNILKKYGLPIARFRTDGSGEEERLINALISCKQQIANE